MKNVKRLESNVWVMSTMMLTHDPNNRRGAYRDYGEIDKKEYVILTAPEYGYNNSKQYKVSHYIDDIFHTPDFIIKTYKELFFDTEEEAVKYIKDNFNLDLSIERLKNEGIYIQD
ncbi:hypothetical protein [Thermosipho sp. (in: thermotogales)]|jgi:hypothetical protein|uniref:hypothetical protein n=1 Tax=Thermosipho sp. (in: thermotogales) TaxID=1968895 RepID=UPI002580A3AF|nr:hypothetical protein [Thermosipho sp. (in: thermotogales)]MBZ4649233.1 hypothetical protein [Thermosipho sp. (in: thermotogales)]